MKKILFTLALIFVLHYSFSQERLGYTKQQIKNEFSYKYNIAEKYAEDGIPYITFDTNLGYWSYYFINNKCFKVMFVPENDEIMQKSIQTYNNTFIKISDYKWRNYSNGKYITVNLEYNKNVGISYFIYYEE